MDVVTIKIKTLTPLWTGDENGKNTVLRETGLIGSLRWWYEMVVKGLGRKACDPTDSESEVKCKDKKHCDVCELFGCTGWARKFRLEVEFSGGQLLPLEPNVKIGTRRGETHLSRRVSGFISDKPIVFKFIPLREITDNEWALLNKTLKVISEYGALGAHTSQGNGVIQIVENGLLQGDSVEIIREKNKTGAANLLEDFFVYKINVTFNKEISELIKNKAFWRQNKSYGDLEDKRDDGWNQLWNDYHFIPIAYHIRDALRRTEGDEGKRHEIFGELGRGSKVFVSHGYRIDDKTVQVRVFGWLTGNREKIKNKLVNGLGEYLFSDNSHSSQDNNLNVKIIEEKSGIEILN
ncbi:type III-B CRISPR module RAMP protein Cmr1 [Caldanaerobius fijiensis]|nr:type III-B CRISPR module RAMP protein Cmr1 [Caldanaerobius fijiensis]